MTLHPDDKSERDLVGRKAVDPRGAKIGTVVDVVHGHDPDDARWALIDLGPLKASHYAPLAEAYRSVDEDLVLNLERRLVAHAPKATREHVLTPELEAELQRYYTSA